jgi:hypothetical protein
VAMVMIAAMAIQRSGLIGCCQNTHGTLAPKPHDAIHSTANTHHTTARASVAGRANYWWDMSDAHTGSHDLAGEEPIVYELG